MFIFGSMIGPKPFLKSSLLVSITLYIVGVAFLFPWLRYYIDYADTFSYIAIAEKYHSGDFSGAVNSTWSPLISWLLSILIFTGLDPIFLFKILQIILGFAGLILTSNLIDRLKMSGVLSFVLKICLVPAFLSYALLWCTPDLLFLDILLWLYLLFLNEEVLNKKTAVTIGLLGGFMYFSKAYAIFFFPLFCVAAYFLLYRKATESGQRNKTIFHAILSLAVFMLLSSVWIYAISSKYGGFTVSYAAGYNASQDIAPTREKETVHRIISSGLYNPTPNQSLFAWEDPALYLPQKKIQGVDWKRKMEVVERNVLTLYYYQYRNQLGWIFLFTIVLGLVFVPKKTTHLSFILFSFTVFVLPSGYFFYLIVSRYIWAVGLLMAISIVYVCHHLLREGKINWLAWILIFITCLLLVKRPVKELLWTEDVGKSAGEIADGVTQLSKTLKNTYSVDKAAFAIVDTLRNRKDMKGRVASFNNPAHYYRESYSMAMIPSYYLHNTYYGQLNDTMIQRTGLQPLFENNIDLYYVWVKDSLNEELIKGFPLLYSDEKTNLRIFRVRN